MHPIHLLLLSILILSGLTQAKLREIELTVSRQEINPDCYSQGYQRLLVNGEHPGPVIRVNKDDELHVKVHNEGNRPTSIHFHGIFQLGTTESDGMPNVTQNDIPPGGTFEHRFRVSEQTGTYFYHAHNDLQDESVHGAFIVYESDEAWPGKEHKLCEYGQEYDDEHILLLGEHWHQHDSERLDYVLGPQYAGMIAADSYLLNGRTVFEQKEGDDDDGEDDCQGYTVLPVEHGKTYRVRVIGGLTFSSLGVAIARHTMTVIEVDGTPIKPYQVPYLEVAPGQRFSILVTADQDPSQNYWIDTKPYQLEQSDYSNGRAILKYNKEKHEMPQELPQFPPGPNEWYFPAMEPAGNSPNGFDGAPDRTIILTPTEERMPDNTSRWYINGHEPPMWDKALLYQLKENKNLALNHTSIELSKQGSGDGFDEATQSFPFFHGEVVDFVVHTTVMLNDGLCAGHPWHSHGQVHYAIANGPGEYIHERDKDLRTYSTPIGKDTTFVYPVDPGSDVQPGTPCGWTKMRFFMVSYCMMQSMEWMVC